MRRSKKAYKGLKLDNHSFLWGVLGLFLFAGSQAEAARPLTTDDVGIVELGVFELEMGFDFFRDEDHTQNQSLGISLKRGFFQRLDLGIGFPYEIKPEEKFGNVEVRLKYLLLKEKANLPGVGLCLGCEFGSSEYTLIGIASREIGNLTFHVNLGYAASSLKGKDGVTVYGGAMEYVFSRRLTLVAELVGEANAEENVLGALIGGNFPISEKVVLDFGIGKGFNTVSAKEGKATLGITCGF